MIVLVSDTSVLIDLERGDLLEAAFTCGMTMVVPDILYERELANHNGPYLKALGLNVVALTPTELQLAQTVHTERKALSLNDCFALGCATRPDHLLVTGDKALRAEAANRGVTVAGLLWLLDQMSNLGVAKEQLHEGLTRIAGHVRCRLPVAEVRVRLGRWAP